jgi:hypothetical protein
LTPNNGEGPFNDEHEPVTPETRPASVHARVTDETRKLIPCIDGRVEGLSESGSYIQTFTDIATGKANLVCAPGGAFVIVGGKLKIVFGPAVPHDEKNTGVFPAAPPPGSPAISVKAGGSLIGNTAGKISGIIPELVAGKEWYVEVRTRYASSSTLLKEIRVIRSSFTLQLA